VRIVGLVGGTSWVSTAEYYRYINEETNRRLGGSSFAECILYSLDLGRIVALMKSGREADVLPILVDTADKLQRAGAEALALCANTMHMFADEVQAKVSLPIIHIAEATGREIAKKRLRTVGLLGTRLTMELDFYKKTLQSMGIDTLVPGAEEREYIDRVIFDELLKEIFKPETKAGLLGIMDDLRAKGAEGIVLGCTEIPLIIHDEDTGLPLFNTTLIHARAVVDFAVGRD
jgi:aspartate racemase